MPPQEEEFELILGNKQLLSLFFLAVVLFAVFFSFGYLVGFGRGQEDRVAAIAAVEPMEPAADEVRLPDTLLEETPRAAVEAGNPPKPAAAQAAGIPASPPAEAPPKAQPPPKKTEEKPEPPRPARESVSNAAAADSIHLQVAAVRVRADAQSYVKQLKAKGYPVSLYDRGGDGWFRVLVGPFSDMDAAEAYKKRLSADGLDSIVRRL